MGIQTGVDKGQSSCQLSVCKRIEGGGGGGVVTRVARLYGKLAVVETSASLSSNKLISSLCPAVTEAPLRTWLLLICPLHNIFYIHNYSPSEYSIVLRSCPVGKRAWFLSTSLLKMLHGLAFHEALPKSPPPLPAFNPGIFEYFMVQSQGWRRRLRHNAITVVSPASSGGATLATKAPLLANRPAGMLGICFPTEGKNSHSFNCKSILFGVS